jgi:hypothetical protein
LDYFEDASFKQGGSLGQIPRGGCCVIIGLLPNGAAKVLLPDPDEGIVIRYAKVSLDVKRLLQKLPSREHGENSAISVAITRQSFRVLPSEGGLAVTNFRSPASEERGRLVSGFIVMFSCIVGTRAQIAQVRAPGDRDGHITGNSHLLVGGWVSFMNLDCSPAFDRLLEETIAMVEKREAAERRRALREAEALHRSTIRKQDYAARVVAEAAEQHRRARLAAGIEEDEESETQDGQVRTLALSLHQPEEPQKADVMYQRPTVTGGWRLVSDPIWQKPFYYNPGFPAEARGTWALTEVLYCGGLEDLLLAQNWHICALDPTAIEILNQPQWDMEVYSDPQLTQEIAKLKQGEMVVVQEFKLQFQIAHVLLPKLRGDKEPYAIDVDGCREGYVKFCTTDGRLLLQALLTDITTGAPKDEVHPGQYVVTPPGNELFVDVWEDQDIESDIIRRLPRGERFNGFQEVVGSRALLHDGGWVSLVHADATPSFCKIVVPPPKKEKPKVFDHRETGVSGFDASAMAAYAGLQDNQPHKIVRGNIDGKEWVSLPQLLGLIDNSRILCDWKRFEDPIKKTHIWHNPWSHTRATLQDLIRQSVWKVVYAVDPQGLAVFRDASRGSERLTVLPRGSVFVAEWITGGLMRMMLPQRPVPVHAWADLLSVTGQPTVQPVTPALHFWVEPKGGHVPKEAQYVGNNEVCELPVRSKADPQSEKIGRLQRGDLIELAEVLGRMARVIIVSRFVLNREEDILPEGGGWIDVLDEDGWSILQFRFPEDKRREDKVPMPEPALIPERPPPPTPRPPQPLPQGFPELLNRIAQKQEQSLATRDWQEKVDPIWGQRYFVNRWSGQICFEPADLGVPRAGVRLMLRFSNLDGSKLTGDTQFQDFVEERFRKIVALLAEVPDAAVEVRLSEPSLIVEALYRAPGVRTTVGRKLQQKKHNANFTQQLLTLVNSIPGIDRIRSSLEPVALDEVELEEVDIHRDVKFSQEKLPPPDKDFENMRRDLKHKRPALMQMPNRILGEANVRALSEGLQNAVTAGVDPFLVELGLWGCGLGNFGSIEIGRALAVGAGSKLETLLLDDNGIGGEGAEELTNGLAACPSLRELGISKNPIGSLAFGGLITSLPSSLWVLDASKTNLDDEGAEALAAQMSSWSCLRVLRLAGNKIQSKGAEAIIKVLPTTSSIRLVDLKDTPVTAQAEDLKTKTEALGVNPSYLSF